MPDIREWIEAQLKRGYSRKQIKSALIRKGYSQKAVAEVDKVEASALQKKQLSKKPGNRIPKGSTSLILVLAVAVVIIYAIYLASGYKSSQGNIATPDTASAYEKFCRNYPSVEGVSCRDAIVFTLEKYRGEVEFLDRVIVPIRSGDQKQAWLVEISFHQPIILFNLTRDKINVTVDMEGNVLLYKLGG